MLCETTKNIFINAFAYKYGNPIFSIGNNGYEGFLGNNCLYKLSSAFVQLAHEICFTLWVFFTQVPVVC